MNFSAVSTVIRSENCFMAALGVAVAVFVASSGVDYANAPFWLAVLSVFVITGAGNAINDYFDREVDKHNAPQRPIPSGNLSPEFVLWFSLGLFLSGILAAWFINPWCFLLATINSILLILYAWKFKGTVLLGNLLVSYMTASVFIYGGLVVGSVFVILFLFAIAFLVNLGREIIGDVEDMKGDKKAGLKTLPLRIGAEKSWLLGKIFIMLAVFTGFLPFSLGIMGTYYLILVLIADVLLIKSVTTTDARSNQKLTKKGMFVGLVAFLVGALA